MWTVPIPPFPADVAYQTCISRVRDKELKKRLEGARKEICWADTQYRQAGEGRNFSGLRPETCCLTGVSAAEMKRVYDGRMAAQRSPGRAIYDAIMMASPHGLCPLCGQRVVATLDHYLPKSRYAALAVNPANLIPACSDCNKAKSDVVADTLHPYFDDIEGDPWLRAELIEVEPAAARFFVDPPASWTPAFAERVMRHFRTFGLNRLYAAHAAYEISGLARLLSEVFISGGTAAVRKYLGDHAQSRREVHLNSWQASLYDCLAGSDWFCSGGFQI